MSDTLDELRKVWYEAQVIPSEIELKAGLREILGEEQPEVVAGVDRALGSSQSKYSAGFLPRWVKSADAEGKTFYFGVGNRQLKSWSCWAAGVGALTTVIAVCVIALYQWKSNPTGSDTDSYTTYTTRAGQLATLSLLDDSHVTLGPASVLRVHRRADKTVVIEVEGEALFNVSHASNHPFMVTAHGVTTRVLGTEFVVRAYDASQIRIAVREGRVSVKSPVFTSANSAIVASGEAVSITPNTVPSVTPITDLAADFGWADGELVLRNVPLGEALVRLSRWYGMNFQVADSSLLKARIVANLLANYSDPEMQSIAKVIRARVTRNGNTVTFSAAE